MKKPVVGVVTFTDSREVALSTEAEEYNRDNHNELVGFLEREGVKVIDSNKELANRDPRFFGLRTETEVEACLDLFNREKIEGLIIGCWKWAFPYLCVRVVKETDVPTLLFAKSDMAWTGATCISAVGASLWETVPNRHALTHTRLRDDLNKVASWVRGVTALEKLKKSSLLLWGGSYCLKMEHLQDDIPKLKSFLVGDILTEDQYLLVKRADHILKERPERINEFMNWLKNNGCSIEYDDKMLNESVLKRQIALYLASRDRLGELEEEKIIGVSIKCQPALSEEYGVTACTLPAFLPFSEDSEGKQDIISTVCEGDIKGLITSALLNQIVPDIPPLFGDLKSVTEDFLTISNCGASSIYYAANSSKAEEVLPNVFIRGQCQGKAGGAIGYRGRGGRVTVARLTRIKGEYQMQLGVGEAVPITDEILDKFIWAKMWPIVAVDLGSDPELFLSIAGANHYSIIPGDRSWEVIYACREAGIPILRIDSNEAMEKAWYEIGERM